MAQGLNGSRAQLINVVMPQWLKGTMGPWGHGAMGQLIIICDVISAISVAPGA